MIVVAVVVVVAAIGIDGGVGVARTTCTSRRRRCSSSRGGGSVLLCLAHQALRLCFGIADHQRRRVRQQASTADVLHGGRGSILRGKAHKSNLSAVSSLAIDHDLAFDDLAEMAEKRM